MHLEEEGGCVRDLLGWPGRLLAVLSCLENQVDDHLLGQVQERVPRCRGTVQMTSVELPARLWLTSKPPSPLGLPTLLHLHIPFPRKASELPRFKVCTLND